MNSDYINLGEASEMWGWDFWARRKLTWISWHIMMLLMLVIWYWFHRNLDHLHLLLLTTATRSPSRVESIRFLQVGHFYNTADQLAQVCGCRNEIFEAKTWRWIDEFHWIWINLAFKLGEVPASCEHQSATIHWNLRRAAHGKASNVQLKVGMNPLNKGNLTNQRVRFLNILSNWDHFEFFLICQ